LNGEERTRTRKRGRERRGRRNDGIRVKTLLYKHWDRVDPDPVHTLSLSAVGLGSGWIWINPTLLERWVDPDPSVSAGLGFVTLGPELLVVALFFVANHTFSLAVWTPAML